MHQTADMWPFHDYGGSGPTVVALHGHFGTSQTFRPLAAALDGRLRVIAPDQRGHGSAPSGDSPDPASYVEPMERFVEHRFAGPVTVYGHSMGGTHAVLLAAQRPDLVRALIIEDAPVDVPPSVLDQSTWPRRAPTFMDLATALQSEGIEDPSYFMLGATRFHDGWGFGFEYADMRESQELLIGNYTDAWKSLAVPTLVLRGAQSPLLSATAAATMTRTNPHARLREFEGCGHWIHDDDPRGVADAVESFVREHAS